MVVEDTLRGVRVGKYQIHQRLAIGGACEVHLAKHQSKDLWIAVKALKPGNADNKALVKQLENEYAILTELKFRSLPRVLGLDNVDGRLAMLMQLGPDSSMTRYISLHGRQHWRRLWMQLVETVAYLHSHEVIHNDLKPDNILVYPDGRILLIDFGLARMVRSNAITRMFVRQKKQTHGTAVYLPPEVRSGKPPSTRSDVYAMGLIAWRLITGKMVGADQDKVEFSKAQGLTLREAAILNRSLAARPENRPESAYDLYRIFRQSNPKLKV